MTEPERRRCRQVIVIGLIYSIVPVLFCSLAAFVSWPLGPNYVNEGGITDLRLAVALLALALSFIAGAMGGAMASLQAQVKELSDRLPKAPERTQQLPPG
jgi:zinc transporter ZupT